MGKETGLSEVSIEAAFFAELGRKVREKRKQRKMSCEDVAAMIGVHRNTVQRWETGDTSITMWELLRVSDVLCCQHLLLLPSREYVWGLDLDPMQRERDRHMRRAVQAERDPPLTEKESRTA